MPLSFDPGEAYQFDWSHEYAVLSGTTTRVTSAVEGDPGFEVNLDATRREAANDNDAEHGVMLRSSIRW